MQGGGGRAAELAGCRREESWGDGSSPAQRQVGRIMEVEQRCSARYEIFAFWPEAIVERVLIITTKIAPTVNSWSPALVYDSIQPHWLIQPFQRLRAKVAE